MFIKNFIMQKLINKYFKKLCSDKYFKNDYETIIGRAKEVIELLKTESEYIKNPENNVDIETIDFNTYKIKELIEKIQDTYSNLNDVIYLFEQPMVGFYVLADRKDLYQDLKEYYIELEED